MQRKKTDWKKVEREYISGIKPAVICEKYKINKNTFDTQRKQGNWTKKKRIYDEKITEKLENKEVDRIQREKDQFSSIANELRLELQNRIKTSKNSIDISNYSRSLKNLQEIVWKSLDIPDKTEHTGEIIIKTDPEIDKW